MVVPTRQPRAGYWPFEPLSGCLDAFFVLDRLLTAATARQPATSRARHGSIARPCPLCHQNRSSTHGNVMKIFQVIRIVL